MEDNDTIFLNYLIVGSDPIRLSSLAFRRILQPKLVTEIKAAIKRDQGWDATSNYPLHKASLTEQDLSLLRHGVTSTLKISQPLSDFELVSDHWPGGFSPGYINFVVDKSPGGTSNVSLYAGPNVNVPSIGVEDNENAQLEVIQTPDRYNSSGLASRSKFKEFQKAKPQILNGRSASATGLPVGLYHPVFDSFRQRIDSTSFVAPPSTYSDTVRLLAASQDFYDKEFGAEGRTEKLKPILDSLLGCYVRTSEEDGSKADGTISAVNGAYCMIMNEIGAGGSDPSKQGEISYARYWGKPRLEWLRKQCCCPSFILAIAGPWICVLGAVMLRHPVVQPLTPFFLAANNSPSYSNDVAKIFSSLATSISELLEYYKTFARGGLNPSRFDPYIRHFTHKGKRVDIKYIAQVKDKEVFRAQALPTAGEPYPIIVKFTESYNATAHRLLETKGLAPKLLFTSSEGSDNFLVAKRMMVVMQRAQGQDVTDMTAVPDCVRKDVSDALKVLHEHNLVFGDLRPPNVLAVEDGHGTVIGAMLVDFDWCGQEGRATYPCNINPAIDWPGGVGPGRTMFMAHDMEMYDKLL